MMLDPVPLLTANATRLLERFDEAIDEHFPVHPFRDGLDAANFEAIMADYVAMSIAFPYIQAGAAYAAYKHSVETRGAPDANARITAAVGSFLTWDEFGGHELVLEDGAPGLLRLTEVDRNFHSALLLSDIERLLGRSFPPARPGPLTRAYLDRLHDGLCCARGQRNVAHMVAFEQHAMAMITALWTGVSALFGIAYGDQPKYFRAHIGTDSAGEAVHVEMTGKMIAALVPADEADRFLETCIEAYRLSHQWCADVVESANRRARAALVA